MAQGKVTDFFSTRKRNPGLQPSKRRKVEITSSEVDISSLDRTNANPYRNLSTNADHDAESEDTRKENSVFSPLQTRASRKAKTLQVTSSVSKKATQTRKAKIDPNQKLISQSFTDPLGLAENGKGEITIAESVTSSWDDHDGVVSTPVKSSTEAASNTRKRTRHGKTSQKEKQKNDEATPEKRQPVEEPKKTETKARKKLQLKQTQSKKEKDSDRCETESAAPEEEIDQPQTSDSTIPAPAEKKNSVKMSANVAAALEKVKSMKEKKEQVKTPSFHDMKTNLAKVGSLDDLKARLVQMKETREKIQAPKLKKFDNIKIEVQGESETKPKVPAYERFHHLATPAAPTLNLPYKYRLLAEQFRGMDQVVSMLTNRSENCTFSKLKVAVQELTKRNFEKQHISKIKTVYPEAYELRQEKGLQNMQGFKQSGYQLTAAARLDDEDVKNSHKTFKASHLLARRNIFHNNLVQIVKQHHKEFLSKLSRPLTIPDDKITRWHPKFPLDEVPDILESPLPQPPDVQTYQTAKDVLESTRGKLSPKVEAALKSTVLETQKSSLAGPVSTPKAPPATKTSSNMKGVPLSLLEKIRAKEAANTAAALTRDPKEEKRLIMLKRLPDVMRIIRSHFVTEKKPALPIDSVIQRVLDSYKTSIAQGDIEPHINLCIEIAPEWISSVQIKKGKYLKIDRNIDLQQLTDKVNNIVKGKK